LRKRTHLVEKEDPSRRESGTSSSSRDGLSREIEHRAGPANGSALHPRPRQAVRSERVACGGCREHGGCGASGASACWAATIGFTATLWPGGNRRKSGRAQCLSSVSPPCVSRPGGRRGGAPADGPTQTSCHVLHFRRCSRARCCMTTWLAPATAKTRPDCLTP